MKEPILYLVEHQTFKVLKEFFNSPIDDELFDFIGLKHNKKVVDFVRLDRENYLFVFEDGESIEYLLRKSEYVSEQSKGSLSKINSIVIWPI